MQGPALRDLVLAVLRFLHPHPVAELDPPGQLEVSVRQRPGEWLVHLVNHGADRDMGGDSFFVEKVPGSGPRTLFVRYKERPQSVMLQPGNRGVEWHAVTDGIRVHIVIIQHNHTTRSHTALPQGRLQRSWKWSADTRIRF